MISPPRSIRWRLPLSYVAIALFAVLALGVVLLAILRSYYLQRELAYLEERAQVISTILASDLQPGIEPTTLHTQLEGLAFLSQARVQLLDMQGVVVADSGLPSLRATFQLPTSRSITRIIETPRTDETPQTDETRLIFSDEISSTQSSVVGSQQQITQQVMISLTLPGEVGRPQSADIDFVFQAPTLDLFGLQDFGDENDLAERSAQVARQPIAGPQGEQLGIVQLSEGPAYGRQIVTSAAWGVLTASIVAILLATVVGVWTSRQLTVPLAQLTEVTAQMASGDLSARANVQRRDELGTLAHSFNEMAQQVDDTVSALQRFVADAAHEINTPLTALRTSLELDDPSELGVQRVEQVMRLEGLVKSLLLLSRLDAGATAPQVEHGQIERGQIASAINMTEFVSSVCEPYASQAEQREIAFVLDLPNPVQDMISTPSIKIRGDRWLLTRALANLLDNALKFSQPGDTVTVRLQSNDVSVQIVVEDTGIGVPDPDFPLLFHRFHRASNAATLPGNGLGLAIVKAIINQQGGRVWAEKRAQGMRFVLAFAD